MPNIFKRLIGVLATSTCLELRQQVQYLKAENEMLRSRVVGRVRVTQQERARLVKLATPLRSMLGALVSIVSPSTILQWIREDGKVKPRRRSTRKPGRPRTKESIRRLIITMAKETNWGYSRLRGELLKLGIKIGRGTIVNILRDAGLPTSPHRGDPTWREFVASHGATLWACDFLRQRIVTPTGFKDAYVLVFVNVATRIAIATKSTLHPDRTRATARAAEFTQSAHEQGARCTMLVRDRDTKFGSEFDAELKARGINTTRLPCRAPNLNAHVERFIQSVQDECLHRFVVMGTGHLDHLVSEYINHYNTERPHMGIGQRVPKESKRGKLRLVRDGEPPKPPGQIRCKTRLGGVLRAYWRVAA
jgi:putative transposase